MHRPATTAPQPPRRTRSGRRTRRLSAIATIATIGILSNLPSAAAAAPSVSVDRAAVVAPSEYFTHVVGDPMDFSNAEDFDVTPRRLVLSGSATLGGGLLTLRGAGQVFLLRTDHGSYPMASTRDPRAIPLDTAAYRRISIRMHSSSAAAAALSFRTCFQPGCVDGAKYFNLVPGWHTYDLDMTGSNDLETVPPGAPAVGGTPWAGQIQYLYLSPAFNSPSKPTLTLDDVRIYQPSVNIGVSVAAGGGPSTELWSDTPGLGEQFVARIGTTTTVTVPGGVLRPGRSTRFFTREGTARSSMSAAVAMPATSRPTPWLHTAGLASGGDWATEVRGDPWDFDQETDAYGVANTTFSVSDGWGHGATTGPTPNDPKLYLNLNGTSIDSTLYHKAVFTVAIDGPWGLEDAPGGGVMARLMWHLHGAPQGAFQMSDDLVLKTGAHTYVVDLKTTPHHAILEPEAENPAPYGWGNPTAPFVDQIRLDPHEDPGFRGWHISDFKLLRNEAVAANGSIRFEDRSWAPGTVADIELDRDRNPANGGVHRIATGRPVTAGLNTVPWSAAGVPAGSYWIRLTLRNAQGVSSTVYSTGQLDVGQRGVGTPPGASQLPPVPKILSAAEILGWIRLIFFIHFVCAPKVVRVGRRWVRRSPCAWFNTPERLRWWG